MIERLQALGEPTKKKVLIIATGIAMVIVIYFWLAYFNNLLTSVTQPTVAQNAVDQAAQTAEPAAGSSFFQGIMNLVHGLGNILQAPRQYIVEPPK